VSRWSQSGKKVSYLREMLAHQYNLYGALGSAAAASVMAIPLGIGPALIPLLAYGAGTTIAALFVPGSPKFQEAVDRRKKLEAREASRAHLIGEITKRVGQEHYNWPVYFRMLERRDALRRAAAVRENAITESDVDRLDDATVDFLGLWLGRVAIEERNHSFSEPKLRARIEALTAEIEATEEGDNKRRLMKARSDLVGLVKRRQEMRTRDAAAEATMLSMADTFDEVYQRVMANPTSEDVVQTELRSAVERLDIEEELDHVLYGEVEALLGNGPRDGGSS
jgi:hypothetical protein